MTMLLSRIARSNCQRLLWQTTTRRTFVSPTLVRWNDLPYHIVVGLPALSPTMERGSLAEWYVNEGDSITAGDSIAQIETDKASMDFEAQDDVYVAKILLQAGEGEVPVGTPIMITVEDEEDVAAFQNYTLPETTTETSSKTSEEAEPTAPEPAPTPEPAAAAPAAVAPPPLPPKESAAPPPTATLPTTPPAFSSSSSSSSSLTPEFVVAWGSSASIKSPLAKTLAAQQKAYLESYGTTGQLPL